MCKPQPIYLQDLKETAQTPFIEEMVLGKDAVLTSAFAQGQEIVVGTYLPHPVTEEQWERGET